MVYNSTAYNLVLLLSSPLLLVCKLAPIHRGKGETEERGRPLQMGRRQVNMQGNLHMRLVLGGYKMSRFLHPPSES